jgi:hypothetical protein
VESSTGEPCGEGVLYGVSSVEVRTETPIHCDGNTDAGTGFWTSTTEGPVRIVALSPAGRVASSALVRMHVGIAPLGLSGLAVFTGAANHRMGLK